MQLEPKVLSEITGVVRQAVMQYSGPLPPPAWLRQYENTVPGAGDRLIAILENETSHRHKVEDALVEKEYRLKSRGQIFALIALIVILLIVAFMAWLGHPTQATALGSATLIGVVALFIIGRKADAKSLTKDDEDSSKSEPTAD